MKLIRYSLRLLVASLLILSISHAGVLVVGGDVNTVDTLPGGVFPQDTEFFDNLLGTGTNVLVRFGLLSFATIPNNYYNSKPGVTSTLVSDITPASLSGVHLLLSMTPNDYTPGETAAIAAFLAGGGTVYLTGEHSGGSAFAVHNALLNNLLTAIGSSLRLLPSFTDCGVEIGGVESANGPQIAPHPLMNGVNAMSYGCTSTVTGGIPLLYANDLTTPILAVEGAVDTAVPEPSTFLAAAGLIWVLVRARKRRGSIVVSKGWTGGERRLEEAPGWSGFAPLPPGSRRGMSASRRIRQIVLHAAIGLAIGSAAFAQATPGPVPTAGPFSIVKGDCGTLISPGAATGSTRCSIVVLGVDYPGFPPRTVPIGKTLIITEISVGAAPPTQVLPYMFRGHAWKQGRI
ncbi:MAG: hypothetical protein ACRD8O_23100 [Bryobacteraceae bacterium]